MSSSIDTENIDCSHHDHLEGKTKVHSVETSDHNFPDSYDTSWCETSDFEISETNNFTLNGSHSSKIDSSLPMSKKYSSLDEEEEETCEPCVATSTSN